MLDARTKKIRSISDDVHANASVLSDRSRKSLDRPKNSPFQNDVSAVPCGELESAAIPLQQVAESRKAVIVAAGAVIANASHEIRSTTRMRVETTINAGVFEAKLIDQMLFSDHRAFRSLLKEISQSGAKKCIFNLSGLTSIDSSGLGMFMIALDEARKSHWTLTIKSPQGHVRSLLVLGRFDKLLNIEA